MAVINFKEHLFFQYPKIIRLLSLDGKIN